MTLNGIHAMDPARFASAPRLEPALYGESSVRDVVTADRMECAA
ncbi:hypothetical protein [Streptomyces sp. NPDC051662]